MGNDRRYGDFYSPLISSPWKALPCGNAALLVPSVTRVAAVPVPATMAAAAAVAEVTAMAAVAALIEVTQ